VPLLLPLLVPALVEFEELLAALDAQGPETTLAFTMPNADTAGRALAARLERFVECHAKARLFRALGSRLYLNLLRQADAIIGNSSSGLLEAPSFGTPTVDIGERQQGRPRAESVISCRAERRAIAAAIAAARQRPKAPVANPYGAGDAARRIVETLRAIGDFRALLKDLEKNQAAARKKERPTMRRRLEQAGFPKATPKSFWMICGTVAALAASAAIVTHQKPVVILLAVFVVGLGLPRWMLSFLTARRKKKFTENFATAIDVIVRSVKSGLPTNEALRIVAREAPDPVGSEFRSLVESMKVGVTMEQGLKRMMESMPTTEVGFFTIVMTIQGKSGGNLSEALGNLAFVLRDRKRLQGKIRAMSSEAKASAMIIGSLPVVVGGLVYLTTPAYIMKLFTERAGNVMIAVCVFWMSCGIMVMRKMINFKH